MIEAQLMELSMIMRTLQVKTTLEPLYKWWRSRMRAYIEIGASRRTAYFLAAQDALDLKADGKLC